MSYLTNNARQNGNAGELIADFYLRQHGYETEIPEGRDTGIDLLVFSAKKPGKKAKLQIKSRGQTENPRWFQLNVPPSWIQEAVDSHSDLNRLWIKRIEMVDFFVLASLPLAEVWLFPSAIVKTIAEENAMFYHKRADNDYSAPHYNPKGNIAKKQKELNLDIAGSDGIPLWKKYQVYRNNLGCLETFFEKA